MSSLVDYAKSELERAGLFDKDSDYEGMLGDAVLDLVKVFAKQGHSGFSAGQTLRIFNKVARYQPLTPLTFAADEWNDVSEFSGRPMWQNKRDSTIFSKDGGKTHYSIEADEKPAAA